MISFKSLILAGCAALIGLSPLPSLAEEKKADVASAAAATTSTSKLPFSEDQRAAMEDFVRNFILDNPEVLMESVNRYQKEEAKKREEGSIKILKENMPYLTSGKHPEIGNPKGDLLIAEFFDYNCGYCKRAMTVVREIAEKDKNVRIVFLELPILSPQSNTASKWALAANKQGKYWEFHQAVLESAAPKDEENLAKIATSVGLNVDQLKKDASSKEIEKYQAEVKSFADKLEITGTPGFVVGEQILRGYMDVEPFKTIIEDERKKSKK